MKRAFIILMAAVVCIGLLAFFGVSNTANIIAPVSASVEKQQPADQTQSSVQSSALSSGGDQATAPEASMGSSGANASDSVTPPSKSEMLDGITPPPNGTVPPPTFIAGFTPVSK